MKKSFYFIFFILFSITSQVNFAQNILNEPQEKKDQIIFPDPINLEKNWWDYFDVDKDEFNVRKNNFIESLNNTKKMLTPKELQIINPLILKISDKLNMLNDYKKDKITIHSFSKEYKENYTLENLIQLGIDQYEIQKKQNTLSFQINLEKQAIKSYEKKIERLITSYYETDKNSLKRLLKGLKLINEQISSEIDKKQLEISSSYFETIKNKYNFLKKEADHAIMNLMLTDEMLDQTNMEKKSLNNDLNIIQKKIETLTSEINLLEYQNKTETPKYFIKMQMLLKATINEANLKLKIIDNEIKEYILILSLNKKKIKTSTLYNNISLFNERYTKISNEISNLKKQADLRFEKATELTLQEQQKNSFILHSEQLSKESIVNLNHLQKNKFLTNYLINQFTLLIKEKYTSFKDILYSWWTSIVIFSKKHAYWLNEPLLKIGKRSITLLGILKFLLILIITYILAKLIKRSIRNLGKKQKRISQYAIYTLSRITFYAIITIGIIISIVFLGVDFTAFAFITGALVVGLGFGLQSIFNNFIAGIILLLEKNVRVGDFIELESKEIGTIIEINVRTTLMRTLDNLEILIPNSDLVLKKFTNWTLTEKIRRVRIPFSIAYGTDKEKVKKVVINASKKVPITLPNKEPDVWLINFGESSLDFELIVWVNEYISDIPIIATKSRYLWAIESALKENNITIPFPQRDVHIHKN